LVSSRSPLARILAPVLLLAAFFLAASPARALDLGQAQRDGRLVAQALAIGARGDWPAAQAAVAGADLLVRDIVLWRKLRSGNGTPEEHRDFLSRRGSWPGLQYLRGGSGGDRGVVAQPVMTGEAAVRLRDFAGAINRRDYFAAENILLHATASPLTLGAPAAWADRRLDLARRAMRERRAPAAYALASQHFLTPAAGYVYSDTEWVAGWVALTALNDPARAIGHFHRFRDTVDTPISLGRGGYWLGRAYEAAGRDAEARRWYADAGRYQTSFYGQLAAARIGMAGDAQLTQAELPDWRTHPATRTDDVRLAATLHFAGEDSLAIQTFSHLGETMAAGALAPLTQLVLDLGQPHYAVRIAKQAAGRGVLIYPAYYPVHEVARYANKVEPALALSIARQETELNPRAVSRAGARGLMQLMPATAQKVAGWIGEAYDKDRLLTDWRYNVRLGETYLARRTAQYGGSYVMAAAAYNAGAGRVDQWVSQFGDPRMPGVDVVDWIENIPFEETRNYVQRVIEALYVYRTRLTGRAGPMTIEQDLARGKR
jgi:soluble lytic murein transglycosylase